MFFEIKENRFIWYRRIYNSRFSGFLENVLKTSVTGELEGAKVRFSP
jgi:hypothetical protein